MMWSALRIASSWTFRFPPPRRAPVARRAPVVIPQPRPTAWVTGGGALTYARAAATPKADAEHANESEGGLDDDAATSTDSDTDSDEEAGKSTNVMKNFRYLSKGAAPDSRNAAGETPRKSTERRMSLWTVSIM